MTGSASPALLHRICHHGSCTAGLAPSLIGNAVSWGLYWVAWKSINGYYCTQQGTQELTWNMKLVTGMQAGTPNKRGIHVLKDCRNSIALPHQSTHSCVCHHMIAIQALTYILDGCLSVS